MLCLNAASSLGPGGAPPPLGGAPPSLGFPEVSETAFYFFLTLLHVVCQVGVFNRISSMQYRRGVVSIWSIFVFQTMLTLYPDGRLTGFALATKTSGASKVYWKRLNWKRSLSVLKWASESEYFER